MTHIGEPDPGALRRKYRRPPIAEAVVEYVFVPVAEWDLVIPGLLYEKLKADYPTRPRPQHHLEAELEMTSGPGIKVRQGVGKLMLSDAEGRLQLGVAKDVFSVHTKPPYGGWFEEFRPRIEKALSAYDEVDPNRALVRVGVRYVNVLPVAATLANARELLNGVPGPVAGLPDEAHTFRFRVEFVNANGSRTLVTVTPTAPELGNQLVLDIDVIAPDLNPVVAVKDALAVTDTLKASLTSAFESLITDEARTLFDA